MTPRSAGRTFVARILSLVPAHSRDPELLKEQGAALSRMVPLLYAILVANTWGLGVTFLGQAPAWLTMYTPLGMTIVCCNRIVAWWRKHGTAIDTEVIARELRRMEWAGALLSIWLCLWSFMLFPYADASGRGHIAFFMAVSLLSAMFCLTTAHGAALMVAAIAGTASITFLAGSGDENLQATAATLFVVTVAAAVVVVTQNRTFIRMVHACTETRQKSEEQGRLLRMIDDMPIAAMTIDPDTFIINYANETAKQLIRQIEHSLPIKADSLIGSCIDVFHMHPGRQRKLLADPAGMPFSSRVTLGGEILDLKVTAVTANDGGYMGLMLTLAIVTKEVEAEKHIWQLARYDALTSLPNRATFHEELRQRLATPGSRASLLFIDLDGFKVVNDTRGHGAGDKLLVQVADRLRTICEGPKTLLARLGGDEFAILAFDEDQEARALAGRIIAELSAPYDLRPGNVRIGASIGIAHAPEHGNTGETLLTRADIALYAAKAAGKGLSQVFNPRMESRIQERVRLESQLRDALRDRQGLFVFYQPIVSIGTGEVTAREALVRWHHPKRGWISPAEFVPVAEQSDLIDALGEFVLETACRDAAAWEDGASVAVNISANQLGKDVLAQHILSALITSGLTPARLEIEITETALLNEERDVIGDLRRIRALGVRVALDDFGTGFSSLAHLRLFPFDKIKIDGSFVKEAVHRPDCAAIVHAVADLGRRLGVTTVAEGVETQAQLECIRDEGCMEVQGYLFGRPAPNTRENPAESGCAANQAG